MCLGGMRRSLRPLDAVRFCLVCTHAFPRSLGILRKVENHCPNHFLGSPKSAVVKVLAEYGKG